MQRKVASMADAANMRSVADAAGEWESPLRVAKEMVATMCRQPKETHWLGVRMEGESKPPTFG
jgi:hypothetical protein